MAGPLPGTGLLKGMKVTLKTLLTRPVTVNYPKVKEVPVPRARGVIALDQCLHRLHAVCPFLSRLVYLHRRP